MATQTPPKAQAPPKAPKVTELPKPTPRKPDEAANERGPVLQIADTAPQAPYVMLQLKGEKEPKRYDLALMSEFPIARQQRLIRMQEEYEQLFQTDIDAIEDEGQRRAAEERLEVLLNRQFELVLKAPIRVKAKCSDFMKSQVVRAFTLAPLQEMAEQMRLAQENSENDSNELSESSISET